MGVTLRRDLFTRNVAYLTAMIPATVSKVDDIVRSLQTKRRALTPKSGVARAVGCPNHPGGYIQCAGRQTQPDPVLSQ